LNLITLLLSQSAPSQEKQRAAGHRERRQGDVGDERRQLVLHHEAPKDRPRQWLVIQWAMIHQPPGNPKKERKMIEQIA
jgi:hypothetical protein